MTERDKSRKPSGKAGASTGAGAEAAEGLHGAGDTGTKAGKPEIGRNAQDQDSAASSGSEPLRGRTTEHKGGYGGEGGAPRTSSDQREQPGKTGTKK